LALSSGLKAQQIATIAGIITDSVTQKPMDNVNIYILEAGIQKGVVSDKNGRFNLSVVANKNVEVTFSYSGYKHVREKFKLHNGERKEVHIVLTEDKINLPSVTIKTENYRNEGITKIEPEWAKNTAGPTSGIETIIKSIGEGTSSNNELSSQYSVRGGNYDENLVYVNDIEIFRPFLIRSGQQEGLSFVNSDMVSDISFSSGGFDAKYGDKMSSVLDIKYKKPQEFAGSASIGLLGGSLHMEGLIGNKISYQIGLRNKTNRWLLSKMDPDAYYDPVFYDIQTFITYDFNTKTSLSFLGNYAINNYKFIPRTKNIPFGSINEMYKLFVAFEGQEEDSFNSLFGALMLNHNPNKNLSLKFIASAFKTNESETYDIQGEYWLNEIGIGDTAGYNKGIGKYIEHARNKLQANIFNIEHKGIFSLSNGSLMWALKAQAEIIDDKQREWKLQDSAGYSIPYTLVEIGQDNDPAVPVLQNVFKSTNNIPSLRFSAFLQREWKFYFDKATMFLNTGIRSSLWTFNNEFLASPRASLSVKPLWKQDILFRVAAGIYQQSPFYREYRDYTGAINYDIKSQKSAHFVLSADWNFQLANRPFRFLSSLYYKYMWDLIPYNLDNVRIRYSAKNNAVGYAEGIDLRLFGQIIEGIDSWITMSVMETKEDIDGDNVGYIYRPTDQLFTMNISFEDYIPGMPYCRAYLNFGFGTGYPFAPDGTPRDDMHSLRPKYLRADIAFTFRIKDEQTKWANKTFLKVIKKIWLNFEWFNVFSNMNVVSYMWIKDIENNPHAVPNYLSPTQINVKLNFEF
jgi:hypothetical protein